MITDLCKESERVLPNFHATTNLERSPNLESTSFTNLNARKKRRFLSRLVTKRKLFFVRSSVTVLRSSVRSRDYIRFFAMHSVNFR